MTPHKPLTGLRVLLVDDEEFIRRVTRQVLSSFKLNNVLEAENGREALETLEKENIDLLITDIQMPEMNGIDLIKQIRMGKLIEKRDLRIIVITSFARVEVLGPCIALDINGFLVKPITPVSAIEKIQRAMTEQVNLQRVDAYREVKTELENTKETATEEMIVNASIIRKQADEPSGSPKGSLVSLQKLEPGMQLGEDLYAKSGAKLISSGQIFNQGLINRVNELGRIIVKKELYINATGK